MLRAAVERTFEIIGEAMTQLAKVDKAVAAQISEYQRIISFRNVLIHEYADVDDKLVWDSIAALPAIAPQFPVNRRRTYSQRRRDALLILSGFLQRVNLVSLILGQLVIRSHKRLRRKWRLKWPGEIYQLAVSMPATQASALTR